jgi:hypothetical protein
MRNNIRKKKAFQQWKVEQVLKIFLQQFFLLENGNWKENILFNMYLMHLLQEKMWLTYKNCWMKGY